MAKFPLAEELLGFRLFSPKAIFEGVSLLTQSRQPIVTINLPQTNPKAIERIISAFTTGGITGMTVLNNTDAQNFIDFAVTIVNTPEILGSTVVTVGVGGNEFSGIALRAPAYTVPALKMVRSLMNLGLSCPKIRIFSGQYGAALVNNFNPEKMWPNTLKLFAVFRLFALKFFQDVSEQVFFDFDRMASLAEIQAEVQLLMRHKKSRAGLAEILKFLTQRGHIHGGDLGEDRALQYLALHPLFFGDRPNTITGWLKKMSGMNFPTYAISLGGAPERFFNCCRFILADLQAYRNPRNLMFMVDVGARPVYYPQAEEPLLDLVSVDALMNKGDSFISWMKLTQGLSAEDYRVLAGDRAEVYAYLSWAKDICEVFELVSLEDDVFGSAVEIVAAAVLSNVCPKDYAEAIDWLIVFGDKAVRISSERRIEILKRVRALLTEHDSIDQIITEILTKT